MQENIIKPLQINNNNVNKNMQALKCIMMSCNKKKKKQG